MVTANRFATASGYSVGPVPEGRVAALASAPRKIVTLIRVAPSSRVINGPKADAARIAGFRRDGIRPPSPGYRSEPTLVTVVLLHGDGNAIRDIRCTLKAGDCVYLFLGQLKRLRGFTRQELPWEYSDPDQVGAVVCGIVAQCRRGHQNSSWILSGSRKTKAAPLAVS